MQKVNKGDVNYAKGSEVVGGRDGLFIEKPDIIDKYCRREITDKNNELEELSPIQFGKMYDPKSKKKSKDIEDIDSNSEDTDGNEAMETAEDGNTSSESISDPWLDDEDRVANFFITTNPDFKYTPLPQYIKLKNPIDSEVPIFE